MPPSPDQPAAGAGTGGAPGAAPGAAPEHRRSVPAEDGAFRARLIDAIGEAYELGDAIGQGGFGRVYLARDRRLGRQVAIKVIRPDLAGASAFLERFRREGVALARLRHPGIVPIYDIREIDGLIFYVMPFIEGDTLRRRLETRGLLPPKVAHRILLELCDAITTTHRAGIVHRDIKPENVILEGRQDKVLLMDFGIAKVTDQVEATIGGMLVGTPTYMSPEQLSADTMVDERSDIYSLGVVAYHLLAGRPPFVGASYGEVMRLHLTTKPEPLRSINPSVPMLLADIVEQCLEKDPLDRFETAGELWDQMQNVTFFRDANAPPEEEVPFIGLNSYLFGTLALGALALGAFGADAFALLDAGDFFSLAGVFAAIAVVASPQTLASDLFRWRPAWLRRG